MIDILLHANTDGFLSGILGHCPWWWIWTIGAFALGAIGHWLLWGSGGDDCSEIEAERDRYHKSATKWEADYMSLKYQLEESQKAEADLRAALARCESDKAILTAGAAGATGLGIASNLGSDEVTGITTAAEDDETEVKAIVAGIPATGDSGGGDLYTGMFREDNFQIIEGIGPKVNQVLIAAGYRTWSELSQASADDLRRHLSEAGKRFALCDPTSWPHQAKLAAAGDWDELIRYQKFTDGGRETTGDFETPSKFEKLAAKKLGFSSNNPNDLKVVEGIGPKIEGLLKEGGVSTWQELADADVNRLQEILTAAGPRYKLAVPRTWPQQAQLAANGEWGALKSLQDNLRSGV